MENSPYRVGHFVGRYWLALLGGFAVLITLAWLYTPSPPPGATSAVSPQQAEAAAALRVAAQASAKEALLAKCSTGADELKKQADADIKAGNYAGAMAKIRECAAAPLDSTTRKLLDSTLIAAQRADEIAVKRGIAAEKARRKREGVNIGMSQEDVLASSWGKPGKINRTIGAGYTHEQWVYGGSYLYFRDGILTTIQN